jgi:hypothetical protein
MPLSHNLILSAPGGHRAKATSENESGLYLSLYDLARDQRDSQRRFEVRRIRWSTRLSREEAGQKDCFAIPAKTFSAPSGTRV